MSDAIAGVNASFERESDTSSGVYVAIAEVTNIAGPSMSRDTIDVTNLDSSGGYREFIAGFRDGGEMVLTMNFTVNGYEQMHIDFANDSPINYQLVLPDPGNYTLAFAGLVTALPLTVPTDTQITMDVTIKITGEVTSTS